MMKILNTILVIIALNLSLGLANNNDLWRVTNGPFGTYVKSINYDRNTCKIYIATNQDGVYRSTNFGKNWEKLNKGELKDNAKVNSVFITKNGKVFAITDSTGVFLLENDYWVKKNSGFGGHLSFNSMFELEDNSLLLASKGKAIFKSTNNGETWSNYNTGLSFNEIVNTIIAVNNDLYLGSNTGFYISKDKGKQWNLLKSDIGAINTLLNYKDSIIFIGTNQGLFVSNLSGSSIKQITDEKINVVSIINDNENLYIVNDKNGIYSLKIDSDSYDLNLILTKSGLQEIFKIEDNFFIAFNQGIFTWDIQNIIYKNEGLSNLTTNDIISVGSYVFCATNNGIYLTTNEGYNWEPANNGFSENLNITSLHFTPSRILLAGTTGDGLYYSEDYGKNWRKNDNPDLTSIYISDIAMDSAGIVYLGTIGKGVFKSSDGGMTWVQMYGNGIENLEITKISVNKNNDLFAGTPNNGMFIKTSTANWRYLDNLPSGIEYVYDIEIIKDSTNVILIISTNLGIYNSYSNGENWIKTNSNLQAPAINLYYNQFDTTLYAGLKYINGLFKSNDYGNTWEYVADKSGLSAKKITSIAMSDLGFLYLGTERGLVFRTNYTVKDIKPEPAKVTVIGQTEFCEGGFTILEADPKYFEIEWSNGKKALYDTIWQSGEYWYTALDTIGFKIKSDTITIEVYPKPTKPYILFNGEILLCSEDAFGYRWYYNNEPISNSNSKTLKPNKDGWYKCEIISEHNCRNISDEIYIELTSVDELQGNQISIYPNPAEDYIIINGKLLPLQDIEIFDYLGNRLLPKVSSSVIDISDLQKGLYFIKINKKEKITILQFIKK